MNQAERVRRGIQAEIELPVTRAAIQHVRQHLLDTLANTGLEASDVRERLYLAVQILPRIEEFLLAVINDGVLARSDIETAEHMMRAAQPRQ